MIKSGDFSFGAYLTHQLAPTCAWTGSPSCFLFSATLGLKMPYHARTVATGAGTSGGGGGITQQQTPFSATHGGGNGAGGRPSPSAATPLAYFVQPDAIFIGNGDLSIDGELLSGTSELENHYGCGMTPRSPEALCALAGTPVFNIDILEVWAVC
jgi:hypothetical protein